MRGPPLIRAGRDSDAADIIALIDRCWSDYPDCPLNVDAEAPELRALASYYARQRGALWMTDDAKGMIATRPATQTVWEICRVYVHPDHHGTALAASLLTHAESFARDHGAIALELWTDTKFHRAHSFYRKHGYVQAAETRSLDDAAGTIELRFTKSELVGSAGRAPH